MEPRPEHQCLQILVDARDMIRADRRRHLDLEDTLYLLAYLGVPLPRLVARPEHLPFKNQTLQDAGVGDLLRPVQCLSTVPTTVATILVSDRPHDFADHFAPSKAAIALIQPAHFVLIPECLRLAMPDPVANFPAKISWRQDWHASDSWVAHCTMVALTTLCKKLSAYPQHHHKNHHTAPVLPGSLRAELIPIFENGVIQPPGPKEITKKAPYCAGPFQRGDQRVA